MQWDIVRATARGRKKRFASVLGLWHHPYEPLDVQGKRYVRVVRSERVDKKVTFPAGDLTLEGRVWLATGSRDVGVVLCHPHPLHGGNMYSLGREAEVAEAVLTFVTH